jgi:hypothetical protein
MAAHSLSALAREHTDALPDASIATLRQIAEADPDLDLRSVAGHTLDQLEKAPEAVG